ncbi:MAG: 1-deoxy-D-xylulose-5-phosphate synthase [Clostridiaceae bacterium]|nr:1-deoxy-D-xylulose-5-phosphate synthase [Clostridiaceae bacterium]
MSNKVCLCSTGVLECIQGPEDLKDLKLCCLQTLAEEIRAFLIDKISQTGGHIASNLGVVELTIALHTVFRSPVDKIVWDVGHQTYVHKILTGRKDSIETIRQMDGISGFPKITESEHDCFNTGHSSTSISAALGMARARDIKGEDYSVVAVIGDGALTGGMAFEALNDAGNSKTNLIVILNDNEMSISKNVGGMSRYLSRIRTEPIYYKVRNDFQSLVDNIPAIGKSARKVFHKVKGSLKYLLLPGVLFEELGFHYYGPLDGHNIAEMYRVFRRVKDIKEPVLIHVCTKKGRGYSPAEEKPQKYHGISPFDVETGEVKKATNGSFSNVFGKKIAELAEKHEDIAAITAAMPEGTGLSLFSEKFPKRFFDVGIAEQHAVTMAAGLAIRGLKPVVAIYSSFLQRAYDQIIHDVSLMNLNVIFAVDRAGIVGDDGETHQGIYDIALFSTLPNITMISPADYDELEKMLEYSVEHGKGPIAIRYPRGQGKRNLVPDLPIEYGKAVKLADGKDITIAVTGHMLDTVIEAAKELAGGGIHCDIIYYRFIRPFDTEMLCESVKKTGLLMTVEDHISSGGFGSIALIKLNNAGINIPAEIAAFPDTPIEHGRRSLLYRKYNLDSKGLKERVIRLLKNKGER